jgi:23S rRNA (cytosine1962-C5)-methyltransferase
MVVLKPERVEAIRARRHPWIYSAAVLEAGEEAQNGELVPVGGRRGEILGWGFYSSGSLIAVRMLSFGGGPPEADWLERRLAAALELRRGLDIQASGYRLVNAEGDRLPGLIVDVYDRTVVVRPLIRGAEKLLDRLLSALLDLLPGCAVYLKREERASRIEGLTVKNGYLAGSGGGREVVAEQGTRLVVDIERGQKTGFYLDQRDNRLLVRRLAAGRSLLDLFAYTGAFSLQAAAGRADRVVAVESSRPAGDVFRESLALNPLLPPERLSWIEGDVFAFLERCDRFELIVVDPPPFARRKSELPGALRGYTRLNRLAMDRVESGGLLLSFCCSGAVSRSDFLTVLREASRQADREVQLLKELHASPDHPVAAVHPEGEYLRGWLLRLS